MEQQLDKGCLAVVKKLLTGGKIVQETGVREKNLLIAGEKIVSLLDPEQNIEDEVEIIDVAGNLILPGIIDAHTHYLLHSRGTTTADDFFSGSRAAALGGVTTFIDYADHQADKSLAESARERISEAEDSVIDFNLHQIVHYYDSKIDSELKEIRELGVSSLKIFTTYKKEGYMIAEEDIPGLLTAACHNDLLLTVHAEDNSIITERLSELKETGTELSLSDHPELRPARAEEEAVKKIAREALANDLPVYFAHISAAESVKALHAVRRQGGRIFGETAPHYLLLDRSYLEKEEPERYFMVPPLRESEHREKIWQALLEGTIQVVATDHCAFTLEQKRENTSALNMLPGLPGSETLLPLIHHFGVNTGMMTYSELVKVLAGNPARIFGLYPERGVIAEGAVADLVVFNPDKKMELGDEIVQSRAGYSPYQGFKILGWPEMTFSRGEIIAREGIFTGSRGRGRFIKAGISSCLSRESNLLQDFKDLE